MDILYYSNYCKHSQKIIQFIVKNSLVDSISCICVDKRSRDAVTHQTMITLENGTKIVLPPNVQCVPALLLVNDKYRLVLGEDIIQHFQSAVSAKNDEATNFNGEPMAFQWTATSGVVSDNYTFFDMTPDELSATGKGNMKQMHNYIKATHELNMIDTPPDTYRPNKISGDVTVDVLQQKRNQEIMGGGVGGGI